MVKVDLTSQRFTSRLLDALLSSPAKASTQTKKDADDNTSSLGRNTGTPQMIHELSSPAKASTQTKKDADDNTSCLGLNTPQMIHENKAKRKRITWGDSTSTANTQDNSNKAKRKRITLSDSTRTEKTQDNSNKAKRKRITLDDLTHTATTQDNSNKAKRKRITLDDLTHTATTQDNSNKAKRKRITWGDSTSTANTQDNSSWSQNQTEAEERLQPELRGYQLIGDSQFCRFGQKLLGLQRVPMHNCPGRIGLCVSGQTITDLHSRVRHHFYPISSNIIVMIGTNDFLRNVSVSKMCQELSSLIKTLQKSAKRIILLTLPPIPKLAEESSIHYQLLECYNEHIRSLENGDTLRIADVSPLYMYSAPDERCRMHLFEQVFKGSSPGYAKNRPDLIHLNKSGLEIIQKFIIKNFF
ncbi:uncharacterized protein LOC128997898 isoform X3 [Macrosteles quadrilineatus]|uniref:uncharacterized protein LOC128997898 isoform X2 n=1 Tax=Macrosteles quadrilineatus TaxID=74068 RepID=UPI0023E2DC30|nr:uncharacterized protein LOC128997898 isoform X2 [Macrosteles quadrilineatus]XP_054279672.1 uncharacterized protein LOC128997898 isoform X3 [Macrosteles quadrilineatus]